MKEIKNLTSVVAGSGGDTARIVVVLEDEVQS